MSPIMARHLKSAFSLYKLLQIMNRINEQVPIMKTFAWTSFVTGILHIDPRVIGCNCTDVPICPFGKSISGGGFDYSNLNFAHHDIVIHWRRWAKPRGYVGWWRNALRVLGFRNLSMIPSPLDRYRDLCSQHCMGAIIHYVIIVRILSGSAQRYYWCLSCGVT